MQVSQRINSIQVRPAKAEDVSAMNKIYNHEITHGMSHYEERVQPDSARLAWFLKLEESGFPVLVVEQGGTVQGFAALTPFHSLSGYRFTVSGMMYVNSNCRGVGIGTALAKELLNQALARGYHSILAGVNSENHAIIALLKRFEFIEAGRFREIGRKNGQWLDDVCLQRIL